MKPLYFLISSLLLFCVIGCSGTSVPEGFPKTVPATITVKDGETPVAGATILLYAQDVHGGWSCSGYTDVGGKAELVTKQGSHMAKGVPVGSYKVALSKAPTAPSELPAEEVARMTYDEQIVYNQKISVELARIPPLIPQALTKPRDTPLTLEVTASGRTLHVDLSKHK